MDADSRPRPPSHMGPAWGSHEGPSGATAETGDGRGRSLADPVQKEHPSVTDHGLTPCGTDSPV